MPKTLLREFVSKKNVMAPGGRGSTSGLYPGFKCTNSDSDFLGGSSGVDLNREARWLDQEAHSLLAILPVSAVL